MSVTGTFMTSKPIAAVAAIGLIGAAIYSLRIMQKVFFGREKSQMKIRDLSSLETLIIASVVFFLIFLGLYPSPVTKTVDPSVHKIISRTEHIQLGVAQPLLEEEKSKNTHGKR